MLFRSGSYRGIYIVNTSGVGFYIYGDREYHGTRLIVLHEDAPEEYETQMLYYKDIVSDPLPGGLVAKQGKYVQSIILLGVGAVIVLAGGGIFVGVRIAKRKKKH